MESMGSYGLEYDAGGVEEIHDFDHMILRQFSPEVFGTMLLFSIQHLWITKYGFKVSKVWASFEEAGMH